MFSKDATLAALLLAAWAVANPVPAPSAAEVCYSGETATLHCYNGSDDAPQGVTVTDIQYVTTYLRKYGRKNPRKPAFYTMNASNTGDCAEWTLYTYGSVLALIKHINTDVSSSVLYEDIATTIDGGENANVTARAGSLMGCQTDGGSQGVLVNSTNLAYSTDQYTNAGYTSDGILIKIVHFAGSS